MTSQALNRPVDVLQVMDNTAVMARLDNSWNSLDEADFQEARAAVAELIAAVGDYVGPMDDPRIGWCSHLASSNDVFRCERCAEENEDSSFIEHKQRCSVLRLLAARAAIGSQP